jgi:hypothetical protein
MFLRQDPLSVRVPLAAGIQSRRRDAILCQGSEEAPLACGLAVAGGDIYVLLPV